jgi:hypothetical protein
MPTHPCGVNRRRRGQSTIEMAFEAGLQGERFRRHAAKLASAWEREGDRLEHLREHLHRVSLPQRQRVLNTCHTGNRVNCESIRLFATEDGELAMVACVRLISVSGHRWLVQGRV